MYKWKVYTIGKSGYQIWNGSEIDANKWRALPNIEKVERFTGL